MTQEFIPFGCGFYSTADAARLLKISAYKIRRWLGGYRYRKAGELREVAPLWVPQFTDEEGTIELDFHDLMEVRFVAAFVAAGLNLRVIRHCLNYARHCVGQDRPFISRRFKTDGKTIFLTGVAQMGDNSLLDLKNAQYVIRQVIEQTFRDLDIVDDEVRSWRPFDGKETIIVDPHYVFGQPMVAGYHVPTVVLAQAVKVEGSERAAADIYEVPVELVRDAVAYEHMLAA